MLRIRCDCAACRSSSQQPRGRNERGASQGPARGGPAMSRRPRQSRSTRCAPCRWSPGWHGRGASTAVTGTSITSFAAGVASSTSRRTRSAISARTISRRCDPKAGAHHAQRLWTALCRPRPTSPGHPDPDRLARDQFLLPRHAGDEPFLRGVIQADRHERVMSVVLHVDHGGPSRSVNRGVMEHQLPGLPALQDGRR